MTMKYFTKEWFFSKLSEEELENIAKEYGDYIDSVFDALPFTLKILSKCVSLHDGIITASTLEGNNQSLQIELFCGNLQSGYFLLQLMYTGVSKSSRNLDQLEKFTEIYTNELEMYQHKRFFHRLLLSSGSEIQVEFLDVSIHICNKTTQDYNNIKAMKRDTVKSSRFQG